ncbi:MAG: DUF5320 domain-containing protein [Chlorobi bacterium]|nr:DUF5320 domain-containing protein [Chlorobiota bacterium]
MPGFDRTGPLGRGAATGRRQGHCADIAGDTAFGNGRFGLGRRHGYGRGFGFANFANRVYDGISEKTILENEINTLKDRLMSLEKRLSEINGKN